MIAASSIELIENPPDDFGESVAALSPAAYFYHTPRYQRFWEEAVQRCATASLGFVFDDGTSLIESDLAGNWKKLASGTQPAWSPVT